MTYPTSEKACSVWSVELRTQSLCSWKVGFELSKEGYFAMQVEIDDGHLNVLGRNEARDHDRVHSFFIYKNDFYKNFETEICPKI